MRLRLSIFCLTFFGALSLNPALADPLQDEVTASLQQGVEAWNRGDLDSFMKGYVEGQDLTYTAGGKVVRGSEALRQRYLGTYGNNRDSMGTLAFSEIEVWPLGGDNALAMGTWMVDFGKLNKPKVRGIFSLVLRRTGSNWLIMHDHTSRLDDGKKT